MKTTLALLSFLFAYCVSYAQDVIVMRDGTKIEAKVLEIGDDYVKYRLFTQPEGPDRIISKSKLTEIVYEDGQFDDFSKIGNEQAPKSTPTKVQEPVKNREAEVPFYFKSGIFFDGSIGFGQNSYSLPNYPYYDEYGNFIYSEPTIQRTNYFSIGFRLGSRWYFGKNENWRPGIQVNWVRLGVHIDPNYVESIIVGPKNISFCNIGMANVIRLNERMGLEINATNGLYLGIDPDSGFVGMGYTVTPEVKLRINRFAVGVDYQFNTADDTPSYNTYPNNSYRHRNQWHMVSLSAGLKF